MKKLIIMLTFASLSSLGFAQDSMKLSSTDANTANKIFKSYYPETTFNFPSTTAVVGFGVLTASYDETTASIECENKVNNALIDYADECGYNNSYFSTDGNRQLIKVIKGGDFFLWSIKTGFFTVKYVNKDNKLVDAYVCYGYDVNLNDHIKVFTKTMKLDENGKVVVPDTSYFPLTTSK